MKFDHLMWAVAIVLAILNGSGVISMPWLWVAAPVILIYAIGAFYGLLLLWMKARDRGDRSAIRQDGEGDSANLLIACVLFFGIALAVLATWVDKWAADARNHPPTLDELSMEDIERMTNEELQALLDRAEADQAAKKKRREEAAIMARYGLEP